MASLGTIIFTGKNGKKYEFDIYEFGTKFKPLSAVYFITNRIKQSDNSYNHTRIYVGETDDLSTRFDNHHKDNCFKKHKANCTCIHLDNSEKSRLEKEKDLIENYHPLCND